ncbi:hypothetical protein G9P44_006003 [Scheffersomyces stipitis]|nr:hypothetical protein G9P44_006003 [Scheffersomyces stipitis]
MFAINPYFQASQQGSTYDFDSLINYLNNVQRQQFHEQSKPKIVKKIETEDEYQIQVYKKTGDFNNYEVRAIKVPKQFSQQPQLINVILQSAKDSFKKTFQFKEQDINVEDINWEWYKQENILVLNVPKKVHVCHSNSFEDLASMLGFPFGAFGLQQQTQKKPTPVAMERSRSEQARLQAEAEEIARKEAEEQLRQQQEEERKAAISRREAEERKAAEALARAEVERARIEAEERAQREAKEKARREAQEKARREAQEKARREAQEKARKIAEAKAAEAKAAEAKRKTAEQERIKQQREAYENMLRQQQEFMNNFFGPYLSHNFGTGSVPVSPPTSRPTSTQATSEKTESPAKANYDSDSESITSEPETSSERSHPKESEEMHRLHKHPSLEEVDDEEFVLFNKKFGDQK